MNYYYVLKKDDQGAVASAMTDLPLRKYSSKILSKGNLLPFDYQILTSDEGVIQDFLGKNMGLDLYSSKMKTILDDFNENANVFDWLSVKVGLKGKNLDYFAIRFFEEPDVLNEDKTRFGYNKSIIVPCFSKEKIGNLYNNNLFYFSRLPFLGGVGGGIVVSDKIKKKLTSEGITGLVFSKAKVE